MKLDFSKLSAPALSTCGTEGTAGTSSIYGDSICPPSPDDARDSLGQALRRAIKLATAGRQTSRLSHEGQITAGQRKPNIYTDVPLVPPDPPFLDDNVSGDEPEDQRQPRSLYEHRLAIEDKKRGAFCKAHREMLGGRCSRHDIMERRKPGNKAAALYDCLLWKLVRCGRTLEKAAQAEIAGGVTVGDILQSEAVNSRSVEDLYINRLALLDITENLIGAGQIWDSLR